MQSKWRLRLLSGYSWISRWIHPRESHAMLLWAALVGCIGGLSAILFRDAIQGVLWAFTRHIGSLEQVAAELPWWQRFIIPAFGGALAGLVLHFGARFGRGDRSSDYMEAVAVREGAISVRKSLVKTASSLLTIGSGGSIGREGAMVQLSAMLSSWLGQRSRLSKPRLRLLVACGAAAGIAGVYNVTFTGALFVAEVVLGSIAMESMGPLLVAAFASSLVSRYVGGAGPYFSSPPFSLTSPLELIPYAAMGLALGVAAPGYIRLLRLSEDAFTALVPRVFLRMTVGGLIVGALSIPFPEVWGNGRTMVNLVLHDPWPWTTLALILVCKVAATAATTGSGAVGGVFTPTMFTGAMLGSLFGHLAGAVWPAPVGGPQAYALVGMAGFLAAVTRAPLMAMLIPFEMTLDYGIVLPLMLVCVVAYYTARSIQSDSIYSESLRRKRPRAALVQSSALQVRDVMRPLPPTVLESTPILEIARLLAGQPYRHLFVVTLQRRLRGVIAMREVQNQLQRREPNEWITAADLMRTGIEAVTPDTGLGEALECFRQFDGERLPVVDHAEERVVVGYVSRTDLLLALAHGLTE